jgi:large subunit ribosomal protein L19
MQANVLQKPQLKTKIAHIQPGDTVRVHQIIREGAKTRTQVFEGLVIRYRKPNDGNAHLTVRKIASGVGVEKSWFVHSPNVEKIEVVRRAKVRRAFLSYMRGLRGKKARLLEQEFDKVAANDVDHRTAAEIAEAKPAEAEASPTDEVVVESTEKIAEKENKQAATENAKSDGDDEQELAAAEAQEGLDKADAEDSNSQSKET